ncbi:MAG: tRNA uridine-5-carboxymethylaminomethyl(34) synthesis GTPase MnmE [Lachnospiraceae bacterium]|nr:tRNA uridine-5-carboxymethylaminomethyl(34) synthesis GTPase MnmE [Lachnospiraceae bacterium]
MSTFNSNDTIAAVSTAPGQAGISIIRISGDEAVSVADRIFNKDVSDIPSHTITYGHILDGQEIVDEVLLSVFKAPRSYTAEDIVEINCHGGYYVTEKILSLVLNNGARLADPGEFTKRAFLNGRIDLCEAESVMDIIRSTDESSHKVSMAQLSGRLSDEIRSIREKILHEVAFIEAALDDPEHYTLDDYGKDLLVTVDKIREEVSVLLNTFDEGALIKNGIKTVIVGKPNAGKSSLLNALSKNERAIVTDIPGTTRDVIEQEILLSGIKLILFDTAGIREASDTVEKIGIDRSLSLIDKADLIIYVVDSSTILDENDEKIISCLNGMPVITVLNKTDLNEKTSEDDLKKRIDSALISVSAKNELGLDKLSDEIKKMFFGGSIMEKEDIYITSARHKKCLSDCLNSLNLVKNSIENGMSEDFYSIDLMDAYVSLGHIIGESMEDDLVDKIFSEFCMGK